MDKGAEITQCLVNEDNLFPKIDSSWRFFKTDKSERNIYTLSEIKDLYDVSEICMNSDIYNIYYYLRSYFSPDMVCIDLNKILMADHVILLKLIMSSSSKEITVKYFSEKEGYTVLSSEDLMLDEDEMDICIAHLFEFRSKLLKNTVFNLNAKLTVSQLVCLKRFILSAPEDINITYNAWNDVDRVTLSSNDPNDEYTDIGSIANAQFQKTFIQSHDAVMARVN